MFFNEGEKTYEYIKNYDEDEEKRCIDWKKVNFTIAVGKKFGRSKITTKYDQTVSDFFIFLHFEVIHSESVNCMYVNASMQFELK